MIGDAVSGWSTDVVMSTTDNVNYTLSNFTFSNGGAKFRQNADWGTNWGANAFPFGTANLNGSNIPVIAGIYNVSFNISTRAFGFTAVEAGFDAISISGTAGPGLNSDTAMLTVDGIHYSLNNYALTAGNLLFRKNNSSAVTWGSTNFPIGTATQGGASMLVSPGTYDISFNKTTGAYSFVFAKIGIIGSATAGGWNTDTLMSTTDGVNYTLEGATLTTGDLKFRQNQSWTINWGASTFPVGTATLNGNNIAVMAGTYSVSFNKNTGTFNFSAGYPVISLSASANSSVELVTLDGVNYYLNNYSISAGNYLFKQNSPSVNSWGTNSFPSGTATLAGASIPVLAGDYNITFNKSTGVFSFNYLTISVIGSATPGGWSSDTNLTTTDGVNYTLSGLALIVGELKFRQGNDWSVNWGSASFPGGTAYNNHNNIAVSSASNFTVNFNKTTGAFYFYDEVNLQATSTVNLCKGSTAASLSAHVHAVPGSIVKCYTRGGTTASPTYTLIPSGIPSPSTSTIGTKTYYMSQTIGGVEGPKVTMVVNVVAIPTAPTTLSGTAAQGVLVGTSTTATYSTTAVTGATSYLWTVPTGVNLVSGQGTTSIVVNFNDVAAGAGAIGSITVKSVNDNGCSSAAAKSLALTKALPAAPAAIKMTNGVTSTAITNFGKYIGTSTILTLTATTVAVASSYVWELPTGMNKLSGGNSNVITVNFLDVPNGTNVLQIGCKSQNGVGTSVTNNATAVPSTTSTSKLLKITAIIPGTPATLSGQVAGLCGGNTYSYTMTAEALNASSYFITAPVGSVVKSESNTSNSTNTLVTNGLTFTVQYPADLNTLAAKTIVVYSRNGVGDSALAKTTTLVTTMPAVTTVTGTATTFQRCTTQSFSVNNAVAGATYTWTVANGAVITGGQGTSTVTIDFSAVASSVVSTKLTVKATNSCNVSSAVKLITLATSECAFSSKENFVDATTISIYPNPAASEFNLDLTTRKDGVVSISIYNIDGAVVSSKDLTITEGINTVTENIADLASGVYFVQFTNHATNETIVKRLIKK